MSEEEYCLIPPYLLDDAGVQTDSGTTRRTYGTLSYNAKRNCWVIKGNPCVTGLCKKLFPGSETGRRGEARISAHRRMIGDLNWLMLRYPLMLRKSDEARWEEALSQARQYAAKKEEARQLPQKRIPEESKFHGQLTDFQQEGLAWLLRTERGLLADEMGLGKTVQSLAMLAESGAYPALIVAPPHLMCNWQNEIARFVTEADGSPLRVHVIKGLSPYALPEADIYLIHYLLLRGWKEALPRLGIPTVIFDEIQELRHGGTEKYSAASLLGESAQKVIGLSGTPIYNHGGEIWNVVNILDYHFLGDYESFSREWCYGYGNQIVAKPGLLGEMLRDEGLMLRRTKQQVLSSLPPKRRLVMPIDSDDTLYGKLMQALREPIEKLRRDEGITPQERSLLYMQLEQAARQATGLAKAPYVVQFVRALLENGEKVLLFAHHHQVMDVYQKGLSAYSPAFITGRENTSQKDKALERFMAGKTDLCCVSLRAASGLNLQRASCVVFGELDWSPAVHSQAEDRAHRMGQQDSILCYYLVSSSGSDSDMQSALGLKVSQFVALMGDDPASEDAMLSGGQDARMFINQLVERLVSGDLRPAQ